MMNKNNNQSIDLLTQKEAAQLLRVSESWFEKQRWKMTGIPYIKIGRKVLYEKKDLVAWLKRAKIKNTSGCHI